MKQTKLLTFFTAMVLVLGLGACGESNAENPSGGDQADENFGNGENSGNETTTDSNYEEFEYDADVSMVITALKEIGSDFNYEDGFYYNVEELVFSELALNLNSLTITATSDNYGYMAQKSYNLILSTTACDNEYYSDGVKTYYYHENSAEEYNEFCTYDFYMSQTTYYFANMVFDDIIKQLEESLEISYLVVDSDSKITNDTIFLKANTTDWVLFYELNVTYSEDGLTYFDYSYTSGTNSYSVSFRAESSVEIPSWYPATN